MAKIEEKIKEVPYVDKLLEIKGIGLKTVCGFIAEAGGICDCEEQLWKACRRKPYQLSRSEESEICAV